MRRRHQGSPLSGKEKVELKSLGLGAHVTHEAPTGAGQHGQREQVEVEGVRLVLALLPNKAGQPKLRNKEALRPIPVLQTCRIA